MHGLTCEILARVDEDAVLSTLLIPGVRLRLRSFQFVLHRAWDRLDPDAFVRWSLEIRQDLFWWFDRKRLELVVSLEQVSSQLDLGSELRSGGVCGQHVSAGLPAESGLGGGTRAAVFGLDSS